MKIIYTFLNRLFLTLIGACTLSAAHAAVTFLEVSADAQPDNETAVQWTVSNQVDVSAYQIEKSVDGFNYTKVGEIPPSANGNTLLTYNWTDAALASGAAYYRIVGIGTSFNPTYSRDVEVSYGNTNNNGIPDITIYPNPVSGTTIHLQTVNIPDGVYNVTMVNEAGQMIWIKQIDHTFGNTMETIELGASLPAGTYYITITGHNGYRINLKLSAY